MSKDIAHSYHTLKYAPPSSSSIYQLTYNSKPFLMGTEFSFLCSSLIRIFMTPTKIQKSQAVHLQSIFQGFSTNIPPCLSWREISQPLLCHQIITWTDLVKHLVPFCKVFGRKTLFEALMLYNFFYISKLISTKAHESWKPFSSVSLSLERSIIFLKTSGINYASWRKTSLHTVCSILSLHTFPPLWYSLTSLHRFPLLQLPPIIRDLGVIILFMPDPLLYESSWKILSFWYCLDNFYILLGWNTTRL